MSSKAKMKKNKNKNKNKVSVPFYRDKRFAGWWKKNWIYPFAFFFPVLVLTLLYVLRSVYPFGDRAYLRMDFYHQYAPFLREFYDRVHGGKSLLFAWQNGMGLNFLAIYAYYLASPFNWLILLWPREGIIEAANFYAVLRGGLASLCLTYVLSRKFHTRSFAVPLFGCIYGLSGFYLAYFCNIIWLDVYFLAPLVLWGVERIAKGKGMKVYLVSVTLCAFSNFYLTFILGICCVFYFIMNLIEVRHQTFKGILAAMGKFLIATLIAILAAAVLLLPAALALRNTPSSGASFPNRWESYFSVWEMLVRFGMNSECIQNNRDLPNIYSSALCIFLMPLFWCNRKVRLRKKISYTLMIAFLLASFEWNVLNYVWHGLHFPNSFPARQSFFLIFLLIIVGFETFQKRAGIPKPALLIASALGIGGFLWGFFRYGKDGGKEALAIYLCTIVWIGLYCLILLMEKNFNRKLFCILFGVVLCGELVINALSTGMKTTVSREAYLRSDGITGELLAYLEETDGEGFYRIEELDRKAVNDAAWDGYNGVSCFSSTIPDGVKSFDDAMGLRTSNVSYSFQGSTPFMNALFGIKYIFAENRYNMGKNYELQTLTLPSGKIYLYENKNVLPLGFVVDAQIKDREDEIDISDRTNPFYNQNSLARALLNDPEAMLYLTVPKTLVNTADDPILTAGAESAQTIRKVQPVQVKIPAGSHAFLYVTSYVDEIKVTAFAGEEVTGKEATYNDLKFKRVIDLGIRDEDALYVIESDEARDILNLHVSILEQEQLEELVGRLRENPMEVLEYTERKIKGKVSGKGGVLFTSIPYDKGWKVWIDGEQVETESFKKAFLCFRVSDGEHEIEMRYTPPGFYLGLGLSLLGLAVMAGLIFYRKKESEISS